MTELHKDRLLKLAAHLRRPETAAHFDQCHWAADARGLLLSIDSGDEARSLIQNCGTTMCIAGHAICLFADSDPIKYIAETAQELLGLSKEQAFDLFLKSANCIKSNLEAADMVERLALTGEVRWDA